MFLLQASMRKMKVNKIKYNKNMVNISTVIVNVFHQLKQYFVSLLKVSKGSEAGISYESNALNGEDINSGTNHTKLMTQNRNEACENKRKENGRFASKISRDSKNIISDKVSDANIDINGKIVRKMEILKKEKLHLLNHMQSNKLAGEKLVNLLGDHGTEAEVEKLLTHISQVEMMTHLLVLLTIRLARVEKKSKVNVNNANILSRRAKLIYQIEDAKRLRQYRKDRGKVVQQIVSKYFEDFWPKFEYFLQMKVCQIVALGELDDKLQFYEETLKELSSI